MRYCRDVVVHAGPLGQVLVVGITIMALRIFANNHHIKDTSACGSRLAGRFD
jgi:hypothetical protein